MITIYGNDKIKKLKSSSRQIPLFKQYNINNNKNVDDDFEKDADNLFHPPSSWMPPERRDAALEMYIKKSRTDVESHFNDLQAKRCKDNLPPEERSAFRRLRNLPEKFTFWLGTGIVICRHSPTGSIVVTNPVAAFRDSH